MKKTLLFLIIALFVIMPLLQSCTDGAPQYKINSDTKSYTLRSAGTASGDFAVPAEYEGKPVTVIGYRAFDGCTGLGSVTIPASVTTIEQGAFLGCTSLRSITVAAENTAYSVVDGCLIENATGTLITAALGSTLPTDGRVTAIGKLAFDGRTDLVNVVLPECIASIGDYAFRDCRSMVSVTLPEGLQSIGGRAFFGCSALTEITVPASVTKIGTAAFVSCTELQTVTFESPDGWFKYSAADSAGRQAVDLSDPVANAELVTRTYRGYELVK